MTARTRTTTAVDALTEAAAHPRGAAGRRARPPRAAGSISATSRRSPTGCSPPCRRCTPSTSRSGPFYDTSGLVAWLGISRQALFDRVRRGTVLACRTADGHLVYPSLQFGRNGAVRPGVQEAVGAFVRKGADGWSIGAWLTTPSPVFDGHSAVDYLVVHRSSPTSVARVTGAAAADASQWAA